MNKKVRIAVSVICLLVLVAWMISISLVASKGGLFVAGMFLLGIFGLGFMVFFIGEHTGWKAKTETSEESKAALVGVSYIEMQEVMAQGQKSTLKGEYTTEVLYPDLERSHSNQEIGLPSWLPDDFKKHW